MPLTEVDMDVGAALAPDSPSITQDPSSLELLGAAARQDSSILASGINFYEKVFEGSRYEPDPEFDFQTRFGADEEAQRYWNWGDRLRWASSDTEYDAIRANLAREIRDRELQASGGFEGWAYSMALGLVNPSTLLPVGGAIRGIRGVGRLAGIAAGGALLDEAILRQQQTQRTVGESALTVLMAGAIGTALGSGAAYLTRRQMLREMSGMADVQNPPAIPSAGAGTIAEPTVQRPTVNLRVLQQEYEAAPSPASGAKLLDGVMEENLHPRYDHELSGSSVIIREGDKEVFRIDVGAGKSVDTAAVRAILKGEDVPTTRGEKAISGDEVTALRRFIEGEVQKVTPRLDTGGVLAPGGAAVADETPGGLRGLPKGVSKFVSQSPVLRLLTEETVPATSRIGAKLADAGLGQNIARMGLAAAPGGTVENRIPRFMGLVTEAQLKHDEAYRKYKSGKSEVGWLGARGIDAQNVLEAVRGSQDGKLTDRQFSEAVTEVLDTGRPSQIPEVNASAEAYRKMYDSIYDEALEVDKAARLSGERGMFAPDVKPNEIKNYINRIYNKNQIIGRRQAWLGLLTEHFNRKLAAEFEEALEKARESAARMEERAGDLDLPLEEARELRKQFLADIDKLDEESADIIALEDQIKSYNTIAKDARPADKAKYQGMIDAIRQADGERIKEFRAKRKTMTRRVRNLGRSAGALEGKALANFEKIEKAEDLQLRKLQSIASAVRRLDKNLAKFDPARIEGLIRELRGKFDRDARSIEGIDQSIEKLDSDDALNFNEWMNLGASRERVATRLERIGTKLEELESIDPIARQQQLSDIYDDLLAEIQLLGNKRAVRSDKLFNESVDLANRAVKTRAEATDLRARAATAEDDLIARYERDFDANLDPRAKLYDFKNKAAQVATLITERILGQSERLVNIDILQDLGERGPEMRRMLDIDWDAEFNGVKFNEFLEKDVNGLSRAYTYTMAPDIELTRTFGTPNAVDIGRPIHEAYVAKQSVVPGVQDGEVRQIPEALLKYTVVGDVAEGAEKLVARMGLERSEAEKIVRRNHKIEAAKQRNLQDLGIIVDRLRHMRGIPKDPHSVLNRVGRFLINYNATIYLGGVLWASVPDLARPMRYGALNAFQNGFTPMVSRLKNVRWEDARRELKFAAGLDTVISSRSLQLVDAIEDMGQGPTKVERFMQLAANKTGKIAMFDYWTTNMKIATTSTYINQLMKDIEKTVTGVEPKNGKIFGILPGKDNHLLRLADAGITPRVAEKIWREVTETPGGGNFHATHGWMPNTNEWTDVVAVRDLRAAIARAVNTTIITPGVERPGFTDASMGHRVVFNLQSFMWASTTKTMLAAAQQVGDEGLYGLFTLAPMVASSLAFGALSYYLWAASRGGKAWEDMQNADVGKWADEAINRGGLLGVLAMAQQYGERIPMVNNYTSFSDDALSKAQGSDLVIRALGPSASTLSRLGNVLTHDWSDPTQSGTNNVKKLIPYNNHFLLDRLVFTPLANATNEVFDIPERRERKQ